MKQYLSAIVIGVALVAPMTQAATKDAASAQSAPKSQAPNPTEFDKSLAKLQQQMTQMQAQMDQIYKTQDPKERQRLLQQHWGTMQSAMNTMRDMWGHGMMGPGMMGGAGPGWAHMGGYYSHLTPEQLRQRQYMTDQYLRMQQEMMNNMMWHQQWMGPPSVGPQ